MSTYKRLLLAIGICSLALTPAAFAITLTVAKSGADFTSINAALKEAMPGDVIKITDQSVYEEQVTIDSTHCPLTITSSDPTALTKPTIKYQDLTHVHPKTADESKVDSLINFDQNGALRLIKAHNVIIDGIGIDGGGVKPFGYPSIWEGRYSLQHGNAAITIWVSSDIIVRNCDISNAYFGINFKDRNLGGIFANPNPADLDTMNNVPLSGFGLTGNHLIERNRIHANSWGFFSESSWDLGTTVRYNLIFENHHPTAAIATAAKGLTSDEGANQPGGAFFFKDVQLSPWAIYNNTLYKNFTVFAGHWQAGYQHLVFNNIIGPPYEYWNSTTLPQFNTNPMELMGVLTNRMLSCVIAAQVQKPQDTYVRITDGLPQIQGANGAAPEQGTLISGGTGAQAGYPRDANVRWLEWTSDMWLSTDEKSANFLEPNWENDYVKNFILGAGWAASGVKNTDGSDADLGAIEHVHGKPSFVATIKPTMPILIQGAQGSLKFTLNPREETELSDPVIKLFRLVKISYKKDSFGNGEKTIVIGANQITSITPPTTPPVKIGPNTYSINVSMGNSEYAFIEMIIEATGKDGKKFTTAVGFIPYRALDYTIKVEVLDKAGKVVTEARVGDTMQLRLTPMKIDGTAFNKPINPLGVTLQSALKLMTPGTGDLNELKYPTGIPGGPDTKPCVFIKIPEGDIENIAAAGIWKNTGTTSGSIAFLGVGSIKILSGPPEKIMFVDPPSNSRGLVPPTLPVGYAYPGTLLVFDRFGNQVNSPAEVVVQSLTPTIANIVGGKPDTVIMTDAEGKGSFKVLTTVNARENDPVMLQGNVKGKPWLDSADMIVGKRAEKLVIFYSDTMSYDLTTKLLGQVGERLQVVVIATKSDTPTVLTTLTTQKGSFTISSPNKSLLFYDSPTAATATNSFTLTDGRVTLWVSSTEVVDNASIALNSEDIIPGNPRDQIYFTRPLVTVDSAFYYDRTGLGVVDSVDIFFKTKLTMISDSIILYWPIKLDLDSIKKSVLGTDPAMKLSADSARITITLAKPFPPDVTGAKSFTDKFGITYNKPNNNPGVQESTLPFIIQDRVGPLVMKGPITNNPTTTTGAVFVERISAAPGIDTLYLSFTESVPLATLKGEGLQLIQNGTKSMLAILNAEQLGNNRFKLVVSSSTAILQAGDSLRINPAGSITDSLGNSSHLLNRPVVLQKKTIPGGIEFAYYLDNQGQCADGVVDSVHLKFNKSVILSDMDMMLEWTGTNGSVKAEHLKQELMSYVGSDSTVVQVYVRGNFSGLVESAIRTSGAMKATVKYNSIGESVSQVVTDSAAPVVVNEAWYKPGSKPVGKADSPDTLFVSFSEPVSKMSAGTDKPFNAIHVDSVSGTVTPYKLKLIVPTTMVLEEDKSDKISKFTYKFIVTSIEDIGSPWSGDSLWIDIGSKITDANGAAQFHDCNRKVPIKVFPTPYNYSLIIDKNPVEPFAKGEKLQVRVVPDTKLIEKVDLWISGQIFDGLGNLLADIPEQKYDRNLPREQGLTVSWDCLNKKGRKVGSGVYVLSMVIKKDGEVYDRPIKKIGVKR